MNKFKRGQAWKTRDGRKVVIVSTKYGSIEKSFMIGAVLTPDYGYQIRAFTQEGESVLSAEYNLISPWPKKQKRKSIWVNEYDTFYIVCKSEEEALSKAEQIEDFSSKFKQALRVAVEYVEKRKK